SLVAVRTTQPPPRSTLFPYTTLFRSFGNKVPVYPGYVCSILCSILLERPVKWIEDKTGNLISTGFARDMYLDSEMALSKDGKILGVRIRADADHGAFYADAQPSKFKIGLLHSTFACY